MLIRNRGEERGKRGSVIDTRPRYEIHTVWYVLYIPNRPSGSGVAVYRASVLLSITEVLYGIVRNSAT